MQETQEAPVPSLGLGQEDLLEEGMATYPELLPGESHGQRKLVGSIGCQRVGQSIGSQRVGVTEAT